MFKAGIIGRRDGPDVLHAHPRGGGGRALLAPCLARRHTPVVAGRGPCTRVGQEGGVAGLLEVAVEEGHQVEEAPHLGGGGEGVKT